MRPLRSLDFHVTLMNNNHVHELKANTWFLGHSVVGPATGMLTLTYSICNFNAVHIYRSWGKVIFSRASVILFTGGVWSGGSGPRGHLVWGGCLVQWAPGWGCLVRGCLVLGVPGPGGAWFRGVWSGGSGLRGEGCLVETPPETATAADGAHPTGMHSCS